MNFIAVLLLFICLPAFIIPAFNLDTVPEFVLREHNLTQTVNTLLNDTNISYNHTVLAT